MTSMRTTVCLCLLWLMPGVSSAQGTRADYERASALQAQTADKVFRDNVELRWLPGGTHAWYRVRTGPSTVEWVLVDLPAGERRAAFDQERLAEALRQAGVDGVAADALPLERASFDAVAQRWTFRAGGRRFHWGLESQELTPAEDADDEPEDEPRGRRRGGRGTGETSLTFVNRLPLKVEIFWLPGGDARTSYGEIPPGSERQQHTFSGHRWLVVDEKGNELGMTVGRDAPRTVEIPRDLRPASVEPRSQDGAPRRPMRIASTSPDGRLRLEARDHNLVLIDVNTAEEHALTSDGVEADRYGGPLVWSPDSRRVVAMRTQPADERNVHIIESAPRDQLQPRLHSYSYLKPGDRVAVSLPRLFDAVERSEIPVHHELFVNPWSIDDVRWESDSTRFTFLFNERGHQTLRILSVDAETGAVTPIVEERSPTFIDYSGKMFRHDLPATNELIWMSERDGWNHLYLYDSRTGEVKNPITQGEWVVRGVELVDEERRQIWFRAGGIHPGQDPYFVHFARVNFDGSGLAILTAGEGSHAIEFSPDRKFFVDAWSRVDLPPVTELRRSSDGSLVCALERADASALQEMGCRAPEPFVAKGRDGETDIYGVICRPSNFQPDRQYPVIENIYAGPQGAFVPKTFRPWFGQQKIAELGFIVVQIDGMGTSHRSKAFHDVCWKNLGDSGFPDRIAWIRAAAEHEPAMDLSRVGIYGGSAGGQSSTRALLAHGDFYKVAVSDCGCHDNRMDKIWWNEQWMGWPIDEHYAEQSNVTQAHRLTGKLLLVVGELDRNVDPASTMQVADALIRADRDFDLLIIPGAGHGACETPYGQRRRQDFFVRHLLGVEPRSE
ncbi:MAG: prolyl oligopeptidase family serine peptidase [Planctomyces sp.]|nr:prolyl oligopeptidase family serine peptidase [Planctomyces sp.]